jgi:hypothetical protein
MELLFYLLTALPYLIAAGLGLALPLILLTIYSRFSAGLTLICLTAVLDACNMSQPFLRIGVTLYPPDIPMVLIAAAAGLRWLVRDDVPRRYTAWALLALVFLLALGLGLARNGTAAGVQIRPEFYAMAVATYAMSFPIAAREIRQLVIAFTSTAVALVALTCYRWVVYYGHISDLLPPGGSYNYDGPIRVIGANLTLVIANVLVLGLFFGATRLGARSAQWLSPVLLAVVLALQHRSVWLALMAGVLVSLIVAREQRAPLWQQVLLCLAIVSTATAPLLFNETLKTQLSNSASTALRGSGTVDARFENWRSTLSQWSAEGPRTIALGRLPGSNTERVVTTEAGESRRISFGAHNHYIGTLTGLGVFGLAALLWILGQTVHGLWRLSNRHDEHSPPSAVLLVLVTMQLVYYVAYGSDYMQYLVLGVALAWLAVRRNATESARPRAPQASSRRSHGVAPA